MSHCSYDAIDKNPTKLKPQVSTKERHVDKCIQTTGAPYFVWSRQPCIVHSQSMIMLSVLHSWTKSIIGNHSTTAVQGLIIGVVNLLFIMDLKKKMFASLVSYCFRIIRRLCPVEKICNNGCGWCMRGIAKQKPLICHTCQESLQWSQLLVKKKKSLQER